MPVTVRPYPRYTIEPSDYTIKYGFGSPSQQLAPKESLSTIQQAFQLHREINNPDESPQNFMQNIVHEYYHDSGTSVEIGPSGRQAYLIPINGVLTNVGSLLVERNREGVGNPGHWWKYPAITDGATGEVLVDAGIDWVPDSQLVITPEGANTGDKHEGGGFALGPIGGVMSGIGADGVDVPGKSDSVESRLANIEDILGRILDVLPTAPRNTRR